MSNSRNLKWQPMVCRDDPQHTSWLRPTQPSYPQFGPVPRCKLCGGMLEEVKTEDGENRKVMSKRRRERLPHLAR